MSKESFIVSPSLHDIIFNLNEAILNPTSKKEYRHLPLLNILIVNIMKLTPKLVPTFGTLITAITASAYSNTPESKERPNILVIVLDDAGYNDFGFMGSKDIKTPNIDTLAANGMIFSDAHVSATVSGPSRAGILTGRYQQRCGYECNLNDTLGLGLQEETIGDIFTKNGYETACIGKWHQGETLDHHPNKRGFKHFYGFISGSRSYFYHPDKDDQPGKAQNLQLNGRQLSFDGYITDVLANAATDYIAKKSQTASPFMMYLAFNAVHTPMEASPEDLELFRDHPRQKLAAMTWALDRGIGKVINKLKETGEYEHTLIFFLSDNGGAHNNQSCNYPLKGFKGNKFEGGHRVPFFMVYGDHFKGKYEGLTSSLDILATAIGVADIPVKTLRHPLDGVDLFHYIKGKRTSEPHAELFWRKEDMAAARIGDYKLIRVKGVGTRLYNLKEDLYETHDSQKENSQKHKELEKALEEWETGLTNPILWGEGVWNDVTREIHRDLMENRKVSRFSPETWKKAQKE